MPVQLKTAPELVRPAGSHWLELEKTGSGRLEPFSREELHPILELELPRVGTVRARFEANRYVASSYNETTGESSPVWSEWRVWLRDVRTPDPEKPELAHLGREAAGIGPATRDAIGEACEPLIRAWLESPEYGESRSRAAAAAIVRELDYPRSYTLNRAEETLEQIRQRDELTPDDAERIRRALELLTGAAELLETP